MKQEIRAMEKESVWEIKKQKEAVKPKPVHKILDKYKREYGKNQEEPEVKAQRRQLAKSPEPRKTRGFNLHGMNKKTQKVFGAVQPYKRSISP